VSPLLERRALLRQLREARDGSPALNAAIALFIGWQRRDRTHNLIGGEPLSEPIAEWCQPGDNCWELGPPPFTTRLDAAVELIKPPNGHRIWTWRIEARLFCEYGDSYCVRITVPSREWQGDAPTAPLAVCITALSVDV
jgi:hypothetical protein